jgi:1-acyl-sn-glycerol-3-phosphate acyltransferase
MLYRFLHSIVNWLTRVLADVTVTGATRMPRGVGVLVVSNHLTNYDPLVISMCFKRELHFMAKVELYRNPLIGWLITHLNAFPVRRGEADRAALRRAEDLLRSRRVVALFPEGHRARNAAVQPSKGGIALLARRANVPILPVAITGTQFLLPKALPHWRPWRRPALTITVGEPFTLPSSTGRADYNALANLIMGHVAELLPLSYRGVFAEDTGMPVAGGRREAGGGS